MKHRSRPSSLGPCPGCGVALEQPSAVVNYGAADGCPRTTAECPDRGAVHPVTDA